MNKIERLGIAGVGPFKAGVSLPIVPGVSILYGRNELSEGNANAVGKSLVGRIIQSVFYEPEIRTDKAKTGRQYVQFSNRGRIVKFLTGDLKDLKLTVDGEDKTARTKTATKAAAAELWGITQDEYQTYGHVDVAVPHPLVKGGSTARKAFFNSFFKLDRMDAEKKVFAKELSEIKKMKAAHAEVVAAFDAARVDMLSKTQRIELESRVVSLEGEAARLSRLYEKAKSSQRVLTFIELSGAKLTRVLKVKPRLVTQVKADLKAALLNEEQVLAYHEYRKDKKAYIEATAGLDMDTPLDDLKTKATRYEKILALTEDNEPSKPRSKKPQPVDRPDSDLAEIESKVRQVKHALAHSKKFARGICETCGQSVDAADPDKLKKQLRRLTAELDAWAAFEDFKSQEAEYEKEDTVYRAEKEKYEGLVEEARSLKKWALLYEKRRFLREPEPVAKPIINEDPDTYRKELELSTFYWDNEDLVEEARNYKPIEFDDTELTKTQERLFKARARLDLHAAVKRRANQLRSRMAELESATKKQGALELILEAYNDKAMKRMAIEAISAHLMASVNKYAALVFDDYKFEFVWGAQIQILVHRPEGTSDVRLLSGAESMLFTIILILSLLMFVPKSKRLNLLILDEPTASFHKATKERFIALLPYLTSIIPSVLIITPDSDFAVPNASRFTVVKTADGSTIRRDNG